jgi:twitching motility two-component system response regulator PilH
VLIVEDDDWFAEQQMRTLTKAGFDIKHAPHGLAAIEALDRSKPDVLVLDIFLPGPNAMALLHELQSYTDLGRLPIIICSNSAADVPEGALKEYGVRCVIDKTSMQPGDLVAAIKRELA